MKKPALLIVSVLLMVATSIQASGWDSLRRLLGADQEETYQPTTKVLLQDRVSGEMLEITGSYNVYNPANGKKLGTRFGDKRYFIQPTASGIKWGEQFPGVYQIEIVPDQVDQTTVLLGGIQYKGSMRIYQIGQTLSFVNEVSLEDYVKSVVSVATRGETLNDEALAALTIVARTNAVYQAQRDPHAYWFVKAQDVHYEGYGVVDPRVEHVAEYTKGLVMRSQEMGNHDGLFAALWTEDSAGRIAPYEVIFRQHANSSSKIVDTPFAGQHREESKWSHTMSKTQLAQVLETGLIKNVVAYRDDSSGKVYGIKVMHSNGDKSFDYETLVAKLGENVVKSSEFTVSEDAESITFNGYGRGHGVGLCLYSANVMASYGKDASEILKEFFPSARLGFAGSTTQGVTR